MKFRHNLLLLTSGVLLSFAVTAFARTPSDPTGFASSADVQAQVKQMRKAIKPGQGFLWQPLVRGGDEVAALEYWTKPAKPAVHPKQAEYVIVIAGSGTMVSGGRMLDPTTTNPDLIEGSRIEGGTTRKLHSGDVFLIPAGTPHWFGIDGDRLVLLGTKIPQTQK
jgi:mannose-6-phosphate isomerase-like protein (cupin superfamily)